MKALITFGKDEAPEGFVKVSPIDIATLPTGEVEEVRGDNVLEKIHDLVSFMDHVYRGLKDGGKAIFASGYYGSANSYMSPLAVRALSEGSMNWCSKSWREQCKVTDINTNIDFEISVSVTTDASVNLRSDEVQNLWRTTRLNCIQGVHFAMTKK